eukprot:scaffold79023_cov47-Prasinocladus_malaysianus.AAC.2
MIPIVEEMLPYDLLNSSSCTSPSIPSSSARLRPTSSSLRSSSSPPFISSRNRFRLAGVRLGGSASRTSPPALGSSSGSNAATGSTEKSSYSTSHATTTSNLPSSSSPFGSNQSSRPAERVWSSPSNPNIIGVWSALPNPGTVRVWCSVTHPDMLRPLVSRRSLTRKDELTSKEWRAVIISSGPRWRGSATHWMPHAIALSRAHCRARGSRSKRTTLQGTGAMPNPMFTN